MFIHGGGWFSGDKTDRQESAWVTLWEQGYADFETPENMERIARFLKQCGL